MADEKQTFILDLDIKDFTEKALSAKGTIESLGGKDNLTGLLEGLVSASAALAIVGTAAFALKTTFDLVFEGEQIKRTNNLFGEMAKSIGVAAEKFKSDLVGATHGLASETEVLEAANKAIVMMGESAAKLPDIMNLARRITQSFGGDVIERFQQLNYAIASGSTRMLRQNGIMIDVDKTVKEYARSLGVSTDMLTEAGRKQAIMNAALEYGQKRIKDVKDAEMQALTTSQQFKVILKEIGEAFVIAFEKIAGPTVRAVMSAMVDLAKSAKDTIVSAFGEGAQKAEADINNLKREIQSTKNLIDQMKKDPAAILNAGNIERATESLKLLEKELRQQEALEGEISRKRESQHVQQAKAHEQTKEEIHEETINREKLHENQMRMAQEILKLKEQHAQRSISMARDEQELETAQQELRMVFVQEHLNKQAEIEEQWQTKKITSHQQYLAMKTAEDEQYYDRLRDLDEKSYAEQSRMDDERLKHSQGMWDGFSNAAKKSANQATGGMTQMGKLGQTTFTVMQKRGSEMFQNLGKAAVDGSMSASEVMKGFFLNALGDIAQSQGEMYLAMGMVPGGQGYLAGGAALLALSGALHALAGGGGGSSMGSGGGGGGGGGFSSDSSGGAASDQSMAAAAPQKSVTIQVMGHYFETEATKTKLMDMVRDATDATDFKYVQIGQT